MSARVATGDVSRKKTLFLLFWGSAVGLEEREVLVTAPAPLALPASSIPGTIEIATASVVFMEHSQGCVSHWPTIMWAQLQGSRGSHT